jgi:hypothetical protein
MLFLLPLCCTILLEIVISDDVEGTNVFRLIYNDP